MCWVIHSGDSWNRPVVCKEQDVMMKAILQIVVLLVMTQSQMVNAATTRLVYTDRPMTLSLRIGHEHRVVFPEPVTVQIPVIATQSLQSMQPTSDTVYWKPSEMMDTNRVLAFSRDQQRIYLLDVSASVDATVQDFSIDNPSLKSQSTHRETRTTQEQQPAYAQETRLENPPAIVLTRFASQTLYAPVRLIPKDRHIQRVRIKPHPQQWPLIRSTKGEALSVETHAAWRGFGLYVTAVSVVNTSPMTVELDMRNVRGNFRHLTPQHTWLGPQGSDDDRTVMYLVSIQPYHSALKGVSHGF